MKRRIFTTYGDEPIKNIKTPIRRFNGETEEDEVTNNTVIYANEDVNTELLFQIRALLVVIIIIKIICLFIKK